MTGLGVQFVTLLLLAMPVACIAWTVTHEEVFREPREYCVRRSKESRALVVRKFFYLFTCEYCFSHYVSAGVLLLTDYRLLYPDWRGLLVSWLSLVWIANIYMSFFGRLRLEIRHERQEIQKQEVLSGGTPHGTTADPAAPAGPGSGPRHRDRQGALRDTGT
jgi:hypothetical protein